MHADIGYWGHVAQFIYWSISRTNKTDSYDTVHYPA